MGKKTKTSNKEDENIQMKEKKSIKRKIKPETFEKNEDTETTTISVSKDNETPIITNEDKCITKKINKKKHNKSLNDDNTPNKKIIFDDNADKKIISESNENPVMSKNEDKRVLKKKSKSKHNKSFTNDNTPNKKIIFDENAEPLEVPVKKKKRENKKGTEPTEDEPTEEDIDQFCDEINEEDNVEYENWVQLIEAKLSSNKKKT